MVSYLRQFSIPIHSLALFRILLGISLLYNLCLVKLPYATAFYGSDPMIPAPLFRAMNGNTAFSVFDWVRNDIFAYIFIGIGIVSSLLLTIGFRTRYAALVSLFVYWNLLQASAKFVFGFDFYTFQLLFWACFLPLDGAFALQKKAASSRPNWAVCAIILYQIAWVYFASGCAKYGESWIGGYAVRNMLMDLWATRPLGTYLANTPWLYQPLTYITLAAECLFPLFVFILFKKHILRYVGVVFLIGFHVSILLMYDVANFSITGLAAAALLLPTHFWARFSSHKSKPDEPVPTATPAIAPITWQRYVLYGFIAFSAYIITEKNLFFLTRYSALKNQACIVQLSEQLRFLDIPSPVKISYFVQFWKMFAPNPPAKVGWLALETTKNDGYTYDFFTDRLIENKPRINWTPKGYEYYLLRYSRTFDYPDESGSQFKLFLKYWIPYVMKREQGNTSDINELYLTDYLYIVTDQSKPHQPEITYNMYKAAEIVAAEYKIESEIPLF